RVLLRDPGEALGGLPVVRPGQPRGGGLRAVQVSLRALPPALERMAVARKRPAAGDGSGSGRTFRSLSPLRAVAGHRAARAGGGSGGEGGPPPVSGARAAGVAVR